MFMYMHLLLSIHLISQLKKYMTIMRYDFVNLITLLSLYKSKRIKYIGFIGKFALQQAPVHFCATATTMFNNVS